MGPSAVSGTCSLASSSLSNHCERDARIYSVREPDELSWMVKHERVCGVKSVEWKVLHHSVYRLRGSHGKFYLPVNYKKRPSIKKSRKKCEIHASTSFNSRPVRSRGSSASLEKVENQQLYHRPSEPLELWGMYLDVTEGTRGQIRRVSLAVLAAAGYVSLLHPSTASASELLKIIYSDPITSTEAMETHFTENIRKELEEEALIQHQVWGITNVCATAIPPALSEQSLYVASVSTQAGNIPPELLQRADDDSFRAWKTLAKELELEGEDVPVPLTRPVTSPSPVKKVIAASMAVAVAGSVAGAASTAGRAVASPGGTAVAASLTALQQSLLPVSRFLARIAKHLGGGAVGATIVYPLDTIKTRMQAQNLDSDEPQYKDEIDCFKQLITKEGPASLCSGLVPQLLSIAPEKAMKLTVNEALLSSLETMMPGSRLWALEFIAGGGGGASQVVFTNPMEIVKVRLQTQKEGEPKKSLWTIVKELGITGLYEGADITLARDVPSSAVFFATYSLLRQLYPEQNFLAGAIAAIPATILVTPMDIIETKLQKEPAPGEPEYADWWECLQDIVNKEGPQALFKGSLLRVLRTSPQFGITLMLYGILCNNA